MKRSVVGDPQCTPPRKRAKLETADDPCTKKKNIKAWTPPSLVKTKSQDSGGAIARRNADAKRLDLQNAEDTIDRILSLTEPQCFPTPLSVPPHSVLASDDSFICYGTLLHLRTDQCRNDETKASFKHEDPTLRVQKDEGRFLIAGSISSKHAVLAQLNLKVTAALNEILELDNIQVDSCVRQCEVKRILAHTSPEASKPKVFVVNISIFGPKLSSRVLGTLLSRKGLYLQDPGLNARCITHENPHLVDFSDLSEEDILNAKAILMPKYFGDLTEPNNWTSILGQLSHSFAAACEIDNSGLKTTLLKHQREAQQFMIRRENGIFEQDLRYWLHEWNDDGSTTYRHTLTGKACFNPPEEPRGGILADEMGLGKTLTAISVILASLGRARTFSSAAPAQCHPLKTTKPPTKATLVVAPSIGILDQWEREVERHAIQSSLKVVRYHGHHRARSTEDLMNFDIVLTTYGTITTEYRNCKSRKIPFHLQWFRIVLDEAQTIRSQDTKQFKAIMSLDALHHWCLSGTPIVNKALDVCALLRFCRVPLLGERSIFGATVVRPFQSSFSHGCSLLRLSMKPICLRRLKYFMPQPHIELCNVEFSSAERQGYDAIFENSRQEIEAMVSGQYDKPKRSTVLQAILQLRMFCNNGKSPTGSNICDTPKLDPDEALTLLEERDEASCASCGSAIPLINQMQDRDSGLIAVCDHILCRSCLEKEEEFVAQTKSFSCPVCKEAMKVRHLDASSTTSESQDEADEPPTKLVKLVDNLVEFQGREKSLVFSVWKRTIDQASELCSRRNVGHLTIHGKTSLPDRKKALDSFRNDPHVSTLLMTMGTGALGLNLTAATRIHILEPQWNPTSEEQAIGRAVRIGQEKNATVIRYIVKDTVEEQIQGYQKRKMQLAAGGFEDATTETQSQAQIKLLTATFFNAT